MKKAHAELSNIDTLNSVMASTHLSDVHIKNGSSTFFSHYNLALQLRKRLILIWPTEWTLAHKNNVLRAVGEYIIIGWMNFPNIRFTYVRVETVSRISCQFKGGDIV